MAYIVAMKQIWHLPLDIHKIADQTDVSIEKFRLTGIGIINMKNKTFLSCGMYNGIYEWNILKWDPWDACPCHSYVCLGLLPDTQNCMLRMHRESRFAPRVSDPDMHHGTCVTHVLWCMPRSVLDGFLWSRWRGKRSRHSRRMRNPEFYVSGKRPMNPVIKCDKISANPHSPKSQTPKIDPFTDTDTRTHAHRMPWNSNW